MDKTISNLIEKLEESLLGLEYQYIEKCGIRSRDGYIPQSFDEIGNSQIREAIIKKFQRRNKRIIAKLASLKNKEIQ